MHEHLEPLVGKTHEAHDHPDGTDAVDVFRAGVLDLRIALGGKREQPIPLESGLDGVHRNVSADEQRQDHRGEDDGVTNR